MSETIKIILIAILLFVQICYMFYKHRVIRVMEEEVKDFATDESKDKE